MFDELKLWLRRLRTLTDTLRDQGVTNLKQLIAWMQSVDVTRQIVDYLRAHPGIQGVIYWVAALGTGLFAVFYAKIFDQVFTIPKAILESAQPWMLLVISPLAMVLSWWLVYKFAPGAAGGG